MQLNPLRDRVEGYFSAIGDGAASNLGSGAAAPGVVAINVGTSAAVRAIPRGEAPLPFGLFRFVVDEERTLLGGAVSNAGNLHAWCLRELRLAPDDRALERLLRTVGTRAAQLTVLPFWVSERAPTWPENLDGTILGLTQTTTAADILQATSAAVCHRLAQIFDQLAGALGRVRRVVVSGGILQSPASLQILADSLGRELVPCLDQEASLRGAAVYALEQMGRKIAAPPYARAIEPRKENVAIARAQRRRQEALEKVILEAVATLPPVPTPPEM
jgi:gluconokinase